MGQTPDNINKEDQETRGVLNFVHEEEDVMIKIVLTYSQKSSDIAAEQLQKHAARIIALLENP